MSFSLLKCWNYDLGKKYITETQELKWLVSTIRLEHGSIARRDEGSQSKKLMRAIKGIYFGNIGNYLQITERFPSLVVIFLLDVSATSAAVLSAPSGKALNAEDAEKIAVPR